MIPEPVKLQYTAHQLQPTLLKEVPPSRKKDLHSLADKLNTVVIDYGSETIKAGFDWSPEGPEIVFRSQVSKTKDPSKPDNLPKASVNTSYEQLDFHKYNYKSPHERNLILHFGLLEQCNDYLLSELSRAGKRIRSPFIVSEPFCNVPQCRASTLQQFFDCYELSTVMVGVDALFAYFYEVDCNFTRYESESALVVHMGANTVHVFCMWQGAVHWPSLKRLNLGGNQSFQVFAKCQILKHPQLKTQLSYSFIRDLYERYTMVALDYREQLKQFMSAIAPPRSSSRVYRNRIEELNAEEVDCVPQIESVSIDFGVIVEVPEEEIRRKEEVKRRMADKLRETISRRKEAKRKLQLLQLKNYCELRQKYELHDKSAHEELTEIFGAHPRDKLEKKIKELEVKLGICEDKDDNKYSLLATPDHELPADKLRIKKLQIYQKQAYENRQLKIRQQEEEELKLRELRENNPETYLLQLKQKYKSKLAKLSENERIRNELNSRKSKLKQRKMQAMVRLVEDEDCFGENEDDWLVCKDGEDSDHYSEVEVMEAELREIDPEWMQVKDDHHLRLENIIFLQADRIKCHEIYFQPKIIGLNQSSLIDVALQSISCLPPAAQQTLLANVVVVGGSSVVPGLKERLQRDLKRECPVGSEINVKIGKGGSKGAFMGMQAIGRNMREFIEKMSFRREEYTERRNPTMFVKNPWSNPA